MSRTDKEIKCIYYRDQELITPDQLARMQKLWGPIPYHSYEGKKGSYMYHTKPYWNEGYNTGLMPVINILSTIQCDPELGAHEVELTDRIDSNLQKWGLTPSTSTRYSSVEESLLVKLVHDAISLFKKEKQDDNECKNANREIPWNELYRVFRIPNRSIVNKLEEQENRASAVPVPDKMHDLEFLYLPSHDAESCYKSYAVIIPQIRYGHQYLEKAKRAVNKFPFIGKLHFTWLDNERKYWQIGVYDYHDSDNAVQVAVNYLLNA